MKEGLRSFLAERIIRISKVSCVLILIACIGCESDVEPAGFVDPIIGTDGPGHTFPGPSRPFGMVQLGPDTRLTGWEGCAGYHHSDHFIYGFSHTHLSGTGALDYGDILVFPFTDDTGIEHGSPEDPDSGYGSTFSHHREYAEAGYYRVKLDKGNIICELTTTTRAGFHSYTFHGRSDPGILVDLTHRDQVISSSIKQTAPDELVGLRRSKSWAQDQYVYFVMKFSKPIKQLQIFSDNLIITGSEANGNNIKAKMFFAASGKNRILVKVGISATSIEGARENLESEIPHWDFNKTRSEAYDEWNNTLSKIEVSGSNKSDLRNFYTAFYHLYLTPNTYMDVSGKYRGRDLLIHEAVNRTHYSVFSLWDTFRAAHPLFTILEPSRTGDFIKTFLRQYEEGGMLPVWELSGNETGTMIGYHSVSVIADAYLKGIRDYSVDEAFMAMRHSAMMDHLGLKFYKNLGYIPASEEGSSVSKTLEYAYDDWCIAQLAKSLGRDTDYVRFIKRAQFYKNVFDPSTGFMRAKMGAQWFSPFDPREVNYNYTEANAWQYSFFVPQDISGMAELFGGPDSLGSKLDQMFNSDSITTGTRQADISGMIGQYAHGNEPSHHMAYLYNFVDQPWKTQTLVHQIMRKFYKDTPDGLCGNEDCGQMSAWYMFSALGFYPVTPGSPIYIMGSPLFKQSLIHLENGNTISIEASGLTEENIFIQNLFINGQSVNRSYVTHDELISGCSIKFEMGNTPNMNWGVGEGNRPVSHITDHPVLVPPFISKGDIAFTDNTEVKISSLSGSDTIFYQIAPINSIAMTGERLYKEPIKLNNTRKVWFYSVTGGQKSPILSGSFHKISKDIKVLELSRYASQYSGGGDQALIDGLRGARNYRTGAWQGFEGDDLVSLIDLGYTRTVHRLTLSCLQDQQVWIFLPEWVKFEVSTDNEQWEDIATVKSELPPSAVGTYLFSFQTDVEKSVRYIRIKAKNYGICPDWHPGSGGPAWIFADELIIE